MQTYAQVGLFVVRDSKTLQCGSLYSGVAISLQVPVFSSSAREAGEGHACQPRLASDSSQP